MNLKKRAESLIPSFTQRYDIAHFHLHTKYFQEKPVVLSKCGAFATESTFKIDDLRGF